MLTCEPTWTLDRTALASLACRLHDSLPGTSYRLHLWLLSSLSLRPASSPKAPGFCYFG